MVHATKILPDNYQPLKTLDLSPSRTIVWLNLAAIPLLIAFGWLFSTIIINLRPVNVFPAGVWHALTTFSLGNLIGLIISIIFMLVLHELIHGMFFSLFTHQAPHFALRSGYAFAAAPEWYLPKYQYVVVGLSPLVIISLLCVLLGAFILASIVPYLVLIAAFNAAGALGDMIVVVWVLVQSRTILVRDQGDKFSTFDAPVQ